MSAICDSCAAIVADVARDAIVADYERLKGFAP
jgi:hypothetical protein